MKLPLVLCVLMLSIHGWCASIIPSQRTARPVTLSHETIVVGWGLIIYLITIFWWAIAAKNSLDKILEDVLQDIDRYPS